MDLLKNPLQEEVLNDVECKSLQIHIDVYIYISYHLYIYIYTHPFLRKGGFLVELPMPIYTDHLQVTLLKLGSFGGAVNGHAVVVDTGPMAQVVFSSANGSEMVL